MIVWQGPSLIDPEQEIVCIVTGFNGTSNPKTGQMLQSWILHAHHHPAAALKSGYDYAICGRCPHRPDPLTGKRSCYVNIMGPSQVWNKYKRGGYEEVSLSEFGHPKFRGRAIRIGAYGDPAAVPLAVWESICYNTRMHTGYTHQWRDCAPAYAKFCMASCESEAEVAEAEAMGYRCFHVTPENLDIQNHILCPASEEAGKKRTCDSCGLCAGNYSDRPNRVPHVRITVHGRGANLYKENHNLNLRRTSSSYQSQGSGRMEGARESQIL